jgi:hypothetical protein
MLAKLRDGFLAPDAHTARSPRSIPRDSSSRPTARSSTARPSPAAAPPRRARSPSSAS